MISWNVQQGSLPAAQVAALSHGQPHIVALQDVFYTVAPEFQDKLTQIGLPYSAYTLPNPPSPILQPAVPASNARLRLPETLRHPKIGVLVASAWPLTVLTSAETSIHLPWPERLLSVTIASPWGAIELHNVYLPHRGHILVLYHMLRALYAGLATPSQRHRILCGDLNLPVDELADGRIITHGQKLVGDQIVVTNALMDEAEHGYCEGWRRSVWWMSFACSTAMSSRAGVIWIRSPRITVCAWTMSWPRPRCARSFSATSTPGANPRRP
jgi:hypothetical protein